MLKEREAADIAMRASCSSVEGSACPATLDASRGRLGSTARHDSSRSIPLHVPLRRSPSPANDLTIHIVDDEDMSRRSVAFALVSAGFTVRAHRCATSFLDLLPVSESICLITDLRTHDMDAIELLERLRQAGFDVPTIVISGHGNIAAAVQTMKAGAADFLEKPLKKERLLTAVNQLLARRRQSPAAPNFERIAARLRQLTGRERQVLAGVLDGLQNKMIAHRLGISSRTVEVHRANAMAKMEARNLAQLMRMALMIEALMIEALDASPAHL